MTSKAKKLVLICTGLGNVNRGFETYIQDLAHVVCNEPTLYKHNVTVLSSGKANVGLAKQVIIPCIRRSSTIWPKKTSFKRRFLVEQFTFFLGMLYFILRNRYAVFYMGEYNLYCYLFKFRKIFRLKYHLVLYTGGQVFPGLFDPKKDYIHHVTDVYYKPNDINYPIDRQFIIPHFLQEDYYFDSNLFLSLKEKAKNKKIFLSVGVIDGSTKQMDLLVRYLSPYSNEVFLIMLGDESEESLQVKNEASRCFGSDGFIVNKVDRGLLHTYYSAADCFILLSPKESFGLAYLEAMLRGKTVIARGFHETKYVLKDTAWLIENDNELPKLLERVIADSMSACCSVNKHSFVSETYTWTALRSLYLDMFSKVCA